MWLKVEKKQMLGTFQNITRKKHGSFFWKVTESEFIRENLTNRMKQCICGTQNAVRQSVSYWCFHTRRSIVDERENDRN